MIINILNAGDFLFDSKLIEPLDNPDVLKGSTYIERNYEKLLNYSAAVLRKHTLENIDIKKYDLLNNVYESIKMKEDDGWYADNDEGTEKIIHDHIFKAAKSNIYFTPTEYSLDVIDVGHENKEINRIDKVDSVIKELEDIIKSDIKHGHKRLIITAIVEPEEILNNDAALAFIRRFNDDEKRLVALGLKSKSGINLTQEERRKFKAWLI